MSNKITIRQIIKSYLSVYRPNEKIAFHLIETAVPNYAFITYGIMVKPSSISRIFRYMREDGDIDIEFTDSTKNSFIVKEKS